MNGKTFIKFFVMALFAGCSDQSTNPKDELVPLTIEEAIHETVVTIADYDSIYITSKESFVLSEKEVDTIFISMKNECNVGYYTYKDTLIPDYIGNPGAYKVVFTKGAKVAPGYQNNLILTYYLIGQNMLTSETILLMYKYPYSSTEIFFNLSENISSGNNTIQGFEIVKNDLYFCPSGGGAGIARYNFVTGKEEYLYVSGSGDHIAADSSYVFHDAGHFNLIRYNINSGEVDLEIDISGLGDLHRISGLGIYESFLYALIEANTGELPSLYKFDYSGNLIEEIPFGKSSYYFTIYNNILYSPAHPSIENSELLRFDLEKKEFMSSVKSPLLSGTMEGIRIYNDKLYYVKWFGPYLFSLNIDELIPVQN